jgi:glycosyltransferase involved in cell wall biosynthesis
MRLGIDGREIQNGVFTGIGRPLADFLTYFSQQTDDNSCVLYSEKKIPLNFGLRVTNRIIPNCYRPYWEQVKLPQAIEYDNIDVFYSPHYKIPLKNKCIKISAIMDLMHLGFETYRQKLGPFRLAYYATAGRIFTRHTDRILTCSENSKRDIINIYNVKPSKIEIIPLGVNSIYRPEKSQTKIEILKNKYGIIGKYLLYVGNFKPHKNVMGIIKAFKSVLVEHRDISLVLGGPKTDGYEKIATSVKEMGLKNRVIFTGKISETDEPHLLYSGAEIFVFPSFYEGFGIPPLEAMACGTPVIASNVASLPEVVGDAGILVNPRHADDIAQAMRQILNNPQLRQTMIDKGLERAKLFNEKIIAGKLYSFIKSCYLHPDEKTRDITKSFRLSAIKSVNH